MANNVLQPLGARNVTKITMESSKLRELERHLFETQRRKKQGLVSTALLEAFVEYVETIEHHIRRSHSHSHNFRATLAPRTSETEYWDSLEDPPRSTVGYCGPYTTVHYDNGTYRIERAVGRSEWYWASREYKEGVTARIEFDGSVTVGELLRIVGSKRPFVSGNSDGGISLTFRVPLERIQMC